MDDDDWSILTFINVITMAVFYRRALFTFTLLLWMHLAASAILVETVNKLKKFQDNALARVLESIVHDSGFSSVAIIHDSKYNDDIALESLLKDMMAYSAVSVWRPDR